METTLINTFVQLFQKAPELMAMLAVVGLFIWHNRKRDEVFRAIWEDSKAVQRDAIEAIRENTGVLAQTAEALRDTIAMIKENTVKKS